MPAAELDIQFEKLLTLYVAHYPQRVRDLAEMIAEATVNERLQDGLDDLAIVFRECIALYCDKHRIRPDELHAAVVEYTTVGARAGSASNA